jgi:hypothetical protein
MALSICLRNNNLDEHKRIYLNKHKIIMGHAKQCPGALVKHTKKGNKKQN